MVRPTLAQHVHDATRMPRPFPVNPRGPRRKRVPLPRLILACPRISPEYELGALRALMKPQDRAAILHREAQQRWPPDGQAAVEEVTTEVRQRLGLTAALHWPLEGNFLFLGHFDPAELQEVKGLAVALSTRLPDLWFTLDRLYLHHAGFFRRQYGFKLKLVPATNVHLTRPVRTSLRGLV